ncbi:PPOX class F420-dependent oxidoreductase [Microbacterium sp. 1P10AE]|uniref:PPOX class F420-dependent oxidoreductase n=1 Tax=Microbacterium sp. 1P10AE TaxID=3132286 RepID=UPI0039A095D9
MPVPDTLWREIASSPFVSLSTYRRDGSAVATPVWIARDGDELIVTTERKTGKVKRLRNDDRVTLRPCSRMGTVAQDAITVQGRARIASPSTEDDRANSALRRKYGWQFRAIIGFEALVRRVQRRAGERVILRISRAD